MILQSAAFIALLAPLSLQEDPWVELLRDAPSGLCILSGSGQGALAVRVAEGGRRLVHVLESDGAQVPIIRRLIGDRGLAGLATVEAWSGPLLPYPDNLVNLATVPATVPEAEVLRVLAPGGAAVVQRGGSWTTIRKPRPAEFDEWTHWRHGSDGNMVSKDKAVNVPTGVRWVAGPAQDVGGKKWYYDHILVSANGRNFYDYEDMILARDAYNGVLLWTRAIKASGFREAGLPLPPNPTPKMKLAGRVSKVRPVALGDRLYVASEGKVLALNAATGETVAEIADAKEPRELLVDGGLLIVTDAASVRAFELAAAAKLAWEAKLEARRIVADGDVLCITTATHVVALDRRTGKERWKTEDADAALALTCTANAGYLVLEKSTLRDDPVGCGIKVYSTKTGELLWIRDYKPDMTHYREARAYFAQGLLWIPAEKEGLLGLEPKNGSERKQWTTRGKHCATPVATEKFFLAPECEFTNFETGEQSRSRMFKSACRQPFIPANGLLYTFPVQCECFPMLRGTMGLSSDKPGELAQAPLLEKGKTEVPAALLKPGEPVGEWPVYRHDAWRSGSTPAPLKRADVRKSWETPIATLPEGPVAAEWKSNPFVRGTLTPPVAAGGSVFVAVPDLHRVIVMDAKSGRQIWTYTAGGRLDGPPTIYQDLCLFGAHDGWVYALRAADGALAWRLRIAPREGRIMAYGQMESPWPVVSSVLIDRDLAFVAAGRHPTAEGGVRVVAFKPRTGEVVWEKAIDNLDAITRWYGGTLKDSKVKVGVDFEPVDMLVRDGDMVAMSRWKFNPTDGKGDLAVDSVTYKTPNGLVVPRGLWGYGIRQTKMVQPKPPAAFDAKIHTGVTGDAAMIVVDGVLVTVTGKGDLRVGEKLVDLGVEPVYDGLISAYGALYLSTQKGTVVCIE